MPMSLEEFVPRGRNSPLLCLASKEGARRDADSSILESLEGDPDHPSPLQGRHN